MKTHVQLTEEFAPIAKEEVKKKGWFWRQLGTIFLDTILPVLFKAILKKYRLVPKGEKEEG